LNEGCGPLIGSYNSWFIEEFKRRVEAVRSEKSSSAASGVHDEIGGYKYECGVIEGLLISTVIADEIKREIDSQ
jgi:hypothetical protein